MDVRIVIGIFFSVVAVITLLWGMVGDTNKASLLISALSLLLAIISFILGAVYSPNNSVVNNYTYQIIDNSQQDTVNENSGNYNTDDGAGEFQLTRPPMPTPRIEDEINDAYIQFDDFE